VTQLSPGHFWKYACYQRVITALKRKTYNGVWQVSEVGAVLGSLIYLFENGNLNNYEVCDHYGLTGLRRQNRLAYMKNYTPSESLSMYAVLWWSLSNLCFDAKQKNHCSLKSPKLESLSPPRFSDPEIFTGQCFTEFSQTQKVHDVGNCFSIIVIMSPMVQEPEIFISHMTSGRLELDLGELFVDYLSLGCYN